MTLSGTITAAALNTEFDAGRSELNTSSALAGLVVPFRGRWIDVTSATDMRDRSVWFKVADLYEVVGLRVDTRGHTSTAMTLTYTLDAIIQNGLDDTTSAHFLGERSDLTIAVATTNNTATKDELDLTATRPFYLRPGVLYRLSVANDNAAAAERCDFLVMAGAPRRNK